MSRLEVRLLGAFEVWHGGKPVDGFESQKVRALLAYLMLHRDVAHSRDRLAGLLWPEKDDDTARRNLRQAVYNLRTTLPNGDTPAPPILTTHQSIQFNPEADYWLDVAAFEDGVQRGLSAGIDPYPLAEASDLYRGDFLAGFFVADSPAFEHWLLYEQERLREMAIQGLRRLVDYYLDGGAYRRGIRYARRLLQIDPLFEEAHRKLMRLYALSDRRSRALAQYDECRQLLQAELGVEPLEETTALYRALLAEEWPSRPPGAGGEGNDLYIPLVGRDAAYARLRRSWETARQGSCRLTLVEGEAGIGKSRLIESFLREAATSGQAVVLSGRCNDQEFVSSHEPLAGMLQSTIATQPEAAQRALAALSRHRRADLARIVPDAAEPGTAGGGRAPLPRHDTRQALLAPVADFLAGLIRASASTGAAESLILFLDDLQWASRTTLDLVEHLLGRLDRTPTWIVAAYRHRDLDPDHPLLAWRRRLSRDQRVDRVALDRLNLSDVQRIARANLEEPQAGELERFLDREGAGLPLTIAELLNYLRDEGTLVRQGNGRWALAGLLPVLAIPSAENLDDLILARVSHLPTSARRLLTLASVVGPRFDADLLQKADGEHRAVVDAAIDMWVERRLVRPDLQPWTLGAAGQTYEFVHDRTRQAIYHEVNRQRRNVMHRQVATALEVRYAGDTWPACETLAYHFLAAGAWSSAVTYLRQAGDKAGQMAMVESALRFYERAVSILERLENASSVEAERRGYLELRFQVLASRAELYSARGVRDEQENDLERMRAIARELDGSEQVSFVMARLGDTES